MDSLSSEPFRLLLESFYLFFVLVLRIGIIDFKIVIVFAPIFVIGGIGRRVKGFIGVEIGIIVDEGRFVFVVFIVVVVIASFLLLFRFVFGFDRCPSRRPIARFRMTEIPAMLRVFPVEIRIVPSCGLVF